MRKTVTYLIILMLLAPSQGLAVQVAESMDVESILKEKEIMVLSLDDCVRLALANSFEVQLAKLDLYVAETELLYSEAVFDTFLFGNIGYSEDKRQELSVFAPDDDQTNVYSFGITKELPTGTEITANWSDTRTWSDTVFVSKNPAHNTEISLEARQPVGKNSFGFVNRSTITLTKLAIENADLETVNRIEEHIANTIKGYVDLMSAKKLLKIFQDILEKAKKLYEVEKKNFDIGLKEKVDLYAAEANVANRQAEAIIAENNYKRTQENLKLLINIQESVEINPAEELKTYPVGRDLPQCLKEAFEYRRDYKIRKREVDIKGLDLRVKGNQMWPEIDLILSMKMNGINGKFNKAAGKATVADHAEYFAGIEFNMPIENSQARSQYQRATYEKEKSLVSLKQTERTVITEVVNTYNDTRSFGASLKYTQQAVDLQSKKLAEETKRFRQGRSKTKIIIDYQRDLLRAELENVEFIRDHRKSKVDLFRSMNVLLKEFEDLI
jgi:outer membrane protein TolC